MGCEFAQGDEWHAEKSLPWDLLQYPLHQGVQRLVRDLNVVYRDFPALHQLDFLPGGFGWISHDDAQNSVLSFTRHAEDGRFVVVVCNFTPLPRPGYRIGVPAVGAYRELINTDATIYGGSGLHNAELASEPVVSHGRAHSLVVTVPPLATVMWVCDGGAAS